MRETERTALERALIMIDALPRDLRPPDDAPLRSNLPGVWPAIGDLRMAAGLIEVVENAYSSWACGEPIDREMREIGRLLGMKGD